MQKPRPSGAAQVTTRLGGRRAEVDYAGFSSSSKCLILESPVCIQSFLSPTPSIPDLSFFLKTHFQWLQFNLLEFFFKWHFKKGLPDRRLPGPSFCEPKHIGTLRATVLKVFVFEIQLYMGLLSGQMDPLGRFMRESGGVSRDSCSLEEKFMSVILGCLQAGV